MPTPSHRGMQPLLHGLEPALGGQGVDRQRLQRHAALSPPRVHGEAVERAPHHVHVRQAHCAGV